MAGPRDGERQHGSGQQDGDDLVDLGADQQGVAPLLATGAYRPLFSSVWATRRMAERLAASVVARLPQPADAMPASLWLEKV